MNSTEFCQQTKEFIKKKIPFFFLIDFEKKTPVALPISSCKSMGIYFSLSNYEQKQQENDIPIESTPISYKRYEQSFNIVKKTINKGDSFLVNLTFPSKIKTENDIKSIYKHAKAIYKLNYKDQFVVFSPESFIQIKNNKISTFPMKGTIMAHVPDAEKTLLNNKKEKWEHNTIVDLMRNDLSMVATNVEVKRFRYISEILTNRGKILQTSSEISGDLYPNWQDDFGHMLLKMLPAGSISGAPKEKTLEIIKKAELDSRSYYTGVFGVYDNGQVDSAIAIRYIEKKENGEFNYRSGGGITFMSEATDEYQELVNKIYVPTR